MRHSFGLCTSRLSSISSMHLCWLSLQAFQRSGSRGIGDTGVGRGWSDEGGMGGQELRPERAAAGVRSCFSSFRWESREEKRTLALSAASSRAPIWLEETNNVGENSKLGHGLNHARLYDLFQDWVIFVQIASPRVTRFLDSVLSYFFLLPFAAMSKRKHLCYFFRLWWKP
jgi:hypothetical protein